MADLERVETPKGVYLAYRKRVRGKAAVDVLPDVLTGVLRDLSFPKQMHWDAMLDDGRGELLFGRPIRWILFLYGGRVVPFVDRPHGSRAERRSCRTCGRRRSPTATGSSRRAAVPGAPSRCVRSTSTSRSCSRTSSSSNARSATPRLPANSTPTRAASAGASARPRSSQSRLLQEVPDLVEYPSVVAGTFAAGVPRTARRGADHDDDSPSALLPGGERRGAAAAGVPGRRQHAARQRRAPSRATSSACSWRGCATRGSSGTRTGGWASRPRLPRLDTVLFHKRLGSYRAKADRIEALAGWIARRGLRRGADDGRRTRGRPGGWPRPIWRRTWCASSPNCRARWAASTPAKRAMPEAVWRAIYYHYLPVARRGRRARRRAADSEGAAVTWAAVSVADKLDTLAGSVRGGRAADRDARPVRPAPSGARPDADADRPAGTDRARRGAAARPDARRGPRRGAGDRRAGCRPGRVARRADAFLLDRLRYVFEQRGFALRRTQRGARSQLDGRPDPLDARRRLEALRQVAASADFQALAVAFKRVKNLSRELKTAPPVPPRPADRAGRGGAAGGLRKPRHGDPVRGGREAV